MGPTGPSTLRLMWVSSLGLGPVVTPRSRTSPGRTPACTAPGKVPAVSGDGAHREGVSLDAAGILEAMRPPRSRGRTDRRRGQPPSDLTLLGEGRRESPDRFISKVIPRQAGRRHRRISLTRDGPDGPIWRTAGDPMLRGRSGRARGPGGRGPLSLVDRRRYPASHEGREILDPTCQDGGCPGGRIAVTEAEIAGRRERRRDRFGQDRMGERGTPGRDAARAA